MELVDLMRPFVVGEKIRLGPNEDGGYVTTRQCLEEADCLFTYGVGNDYRYEEEFAARYNKPVHMFDHTIGQQDWVRGLIHFHNEGLGYKDRCGDFLDHIKQYAPGQRCLLKVDIEGGEYDYFSKVDINKLAEVCTGILVEVHFIDNSEYRQSCIDIMKKIGEKYILSHIHGNAWGTFFNYQGVVLPITFEASFDLMQFDTVYLLDKQKYPIPGLDVSNRPGHPDIDLKYIYE